MVCDKSNNSKTARALFVWDGTNRFVQNADQFIDLFEDQIVYAVHAMPHESIYAHGTVSHSCLNEYSSLERQFHSSFHRSVRNSKHLRQASFELLFGDRINEIARFASLIKATFVLIPSFRQSTFSKWVHGDLNEKISRKSNCPVIFLDSDLSPEDRNVRPSIDIDSKISARDKLLCHIDKFFFNADCL